jgi:hypothetical protein
MAAEEAVLVIMDFPARPPGGPDQSMALKALAESIAQEPGLIWKIWTEDRSGGRAGGIYLFSSRETAEAYHAMHAERLGRQGIGPIRAEYRSANMALTALTRGPVPAALQAAEKR